MVRRKPWCVVPKEIGAPENGITCSAQPGRPSTKISKPVLGPGDLTTTAGDIIARSRPRVEVADRSLVLGARRLAWSRELALTTLAARRACPRLGDCSFPTHSRARGHLDCGGRHDSP